MCKAFRGLATQTPKAENVTLQLLLTHFLVAAAQLQKKHLGDAQYAEERLLVVSLDTCSFLLFTLELFWE